MRVIVAALVGLNVGACASVTRGTTENMTFISEPSGATVTTSIGYTCPATPCTTEIKRSAEFSRRETVTGLGGRLYQLAS
jgi:hypothetical protein